MTTPTDRRQACLDATVAWDALADTEARCGGLAAKVQTYRDCAAMLRREAEDGVWRCVCHGKTQAEWQQLDLAARGRR